MCVCVSVSSVKNMCCVCAYMCVVVCVYVSVNVCNCVPPPWFRYSSSCHRRKTCACGAEMRYDKYSTIPMAHANSYTCVWPNILTHTETLGAVLANRRKIACLNPIYMIVSVFVFVNVCMKPVLLGFLSSSSTASSPESNSLPCLTVNRTTDFNHGD